jgi:hypothetical protein
MRIYLFVIFFNLFFGTSHSSNDYLCQKDIYKSEEKNSSLMKKISDQITNVENRGKISSHRIWSKSFVSTQAFLDSKKIFSFSSELIRNATEEVLIHVFIFDIKSSGMKKIYDALYDLEEKTRSAKKKRPLKVKILIDLFNLSDIINAKKFIDKNKKDYKESSENFKGYGINMPSPLDPKIIELEIRYLKHLFSGANRSRSIVIDREKVVISGAKFTSLDSGKKIVAVAEHALYFVGDIGLGLADEFYYNYNQAK